ncbi:MAG: aminotransferase class I/II-fold pyridoxal phosphate-dependent enzyme [Ruminococcaceae bacterium]|nr:aminotransferase class I/II-fold pyridoxal phosphate-dependent enzyme [Oscillospiraceae bacterium]
MKYAIMSQKDLNKLLETEKEKYSEYLNMNLKYDMTRGKPSVKQLALSDDMMSDRYVGNYKASNGLDCRNYGILEGIPEIRSLFGEIFGVAPEQVIAGGNSSLNIMYDLISAFLLLGTAKDSTPWVKQGEIKFICPVPGYDRHFAITERLGIKMINVNINDDGPDMDVIEELVKNDASIKGMWSVPKYSNPTGVVYSDEVIRRLAKMECAADDFRIIWDDAYSVHMLEGEPAKQLNLIDACKEAGNPDRAIVLASTSKMTYPGAGISAVASSIDNINWFKYVFTIQTIGPNKINQLRHANYFGNYDNVVAHMKKHAEILNPKFKRVIQIFEEELSEADILKWSNPKGGYFISIDTVYNCASEVVAMAKKCGVLFTEAGSTFPYRKDPENKNIRIAPSMPPIEELEVAIRVLCVCVKICSIEKLLDK